MTALIKRFMRDESGATAMEYSIIAAAISVAIMSIVQGLGSKLNATMTGVANGLN
jgi:pilus assembly protein Flp/PilA